MLSVKMVAVDVEVVADRVVADRVALSVKMVAEKRKMPMTEMVAEKRKMVKTESSPPQIPLSRGCTAVASWMTMVAANAEDADGLYGCDCDGCHCDSCHCDGCNCVGYALVPALVPSLVPALVPSRMKMPWESELQIADGLGCRLYQNGCQYICKEHM